MARCVFLSGASGFVGREILRTLLRHNIAVHALVNRNPLPATEPTVSSFPGGLFNPDAIDRAMMSCDVAIHLVGIIMESPRQGLTFDRIHVEGTRNIVEAAKRAGVRRFIHMSALGTRRHALSRYHRTKWLAEEIVRESGLDFTIIRPSLIHGEHGEFMRLSAQWARKRAPAPIFFMPFMPYFGAGLFGTGGAGQLQPVFVEDVARAFVECIDNPKAVGKTYAIGGADVVSWRELHETISRAVVGKKRWIMPIPVWVAKVQAAIGLGGLLGFNRDQVIMSQEDNICDNSEIASDLGFAPRGFEESLRTYANRL
jgi:NADH dehydrogenase